jgi:maltodextrin utilization protein YvdJ
LWRDGIFLELMSIKKIVAILLGLCAVIVIIIGLVNFNLMLDIWVKVLIMVLFIGVIAAIIKRFFK